MPISQAKRKANDKWDKANMTVFSVKMTNKLHNKLQEAVQINNTNRNAYVLNAIKEALKRDGFSDFEQKSGTDQNE